MKETDDDDYGGGREQDPMMLAKGKRLGQPAASRGEASVRFVLPHITFLGGEDGEALIESPSRPSGPQYSKAAASSVETGETTQS